MTIDYNRTHIHFVTVSVRNDKKLKSVTLPVQSSQINFFSVSLISADASVAAGAMEAEALASSGQQVLDSGAAPSAAPALSVQTVPLPRPTLQSPAFAAISQPILIFLERVHRLVASPVPKNLPLPPTADH